MPQGTSTQRGYGSSHQRARAQWKPYVDALEVTCWRCGRLIIPDPTKRGDGWDLGHDDDDRSRYKGPEHSDQCNRKAGARRGAAVTNAKRRTRTIAREW